MVKDTWSLDVALAKWLLPRLKILKKNKHGLPVESFPEGKKYLGKDGHPNKAAWKLAKKNWDTAIDSMILAMETASRDWGKYGLAYKEKVQPGLDALARHFGNLWD
jgi:hypothetical protein